jgi:hypothetical protein
MRLFPSILVTISVILFAPTTAGAQTLSPKGLRDDPDGMPGERVLRQDIEMGAGVKLTALIEETNKGNGLLSIGTLKLKVVDEHEDGAVYAGAVPHVEFADIDGDGIKELVVNGIVEYTDEKADVVREREAFVFIYRYDKAKGFKLAFKRASFALEDGPQARP